MAEKKLEGAGLRGQVAGQTALSTVGKEGKGLTYRGYAIEELSEKASFEEVAYMLLYGNLPNQSELSEYKEKLKKYRELPSELKKVLELIPASAHPMDVLRTGCSFLGNIEPEGDFSNQADISDRLISIFPSVVCYWYRYSHDGVSIETATDHDSIGGHFLSMLTGKEPSEDDARCLDVSLILYAEHGFNASTFTARTCASTLSDLHSCITGAIGTLRGPLHGGANEAAMEMIEKFSSREEANAGVKKMLEAKEKIMGHMTAIKKPIAGNATLATFAEPNSAAAKQISTMEVNKISTLRESIIFNKNRPNTVPAVINPQNVDTAEAPSVCGSSPW